MTIKEVVTIIGPGFPTEPYFGREPVGTPSEIEAVGLDRKTVPSCWRHTRRTKGCEFWKRCPLKKGKRGRKSAGPYLLQIGQKVVPCFEFMRGRP